MWCNKEKKQIIELNERNNANLLEFGKKASALEQINQTLLAKNTELEQKNQTLLAKNTELEQTNQTLLHENNRLKGEGELKLQNEKLLTENTQLEKNNQTLLNEKIKLETDIAPQQSMIELITELNRDFLTENTYDHNILTKLLELKKVIDSKRWFIPRVPLDIHHSNNYVVIQPQNGIECFVKIKLPSVQYVKGVCYITKEIVLTKDGFNYGMQGELYQAPEYAERVNITFRADDMLVDVTVAKRSDSNYYKLRDGLQTPVDAVLAKCYADIIANERSIHSTTPSFSPVEHNTDADTKNKLILERIQSEMTRIIRDVETQINSQIGKITQNIKNVNKIKQQFDSKCWIIPRVPLDIQHPDNYENIEVPHNDSTNTYYFKYELLKSQKVRFIPGTFTPTKI